MLQAHVEYNMDRRTDNLKLSWDVLKKASCFATLRGLRSSAETQCKLPVVVIFSRHDVRIGKYENVLKT